MSSKDVDKTVDELNKFMDDHFVLCTMKKDEKGLPVLVRIN